MAHFTLAFTGCLSVRFVNFTLAATSPFAQAPSPTALTSIGLRYDALKNNAHSLIMVICLSLSSFAYVEPDSDIMRTARVGPAAYSARFVQ